jgi:hypothetical protein
MVDECWAEMGSFTSICGKEALGRTGRIYGHEFLGRGGRVYYTIPQRGRRTSAMYACLASSSRINNRLVAHVEEKENAGEGGEMIGAAANKGCSYRKDYCMHGMIWI